MLFASQKSTSDILKSMLLLLMDWREAGAALTCSCFLHCWSAI